MRYEERKRDTNRSAIRDDRTAHAIGRCGATRARWTVMQNAVMIVTVIGIPG
jgi:hypothetical protein